MSALRGDIRSIRFRFSADPILERRTSGIAVGSERVDKIVRKLAVHCVAERTNEAARHSRNAPSAENHPGTRRVRIRGLGVRLSFRRAYGSPRFTNSASAASGIRSKAGSIRRRRLRVPGFFPTSEPANLDDASLRNPSIPSPTAPGSNYPQPSISWLPRWSVTVPHGAKRRCRPSRLRRMRMRRPF
jgi:hypothetical protein